MEDPEFELRDLRQGKADADGLGGGPQDPFRDPSFGRRIWISLASVVLLIALVLIAAVGGPLRSVLESLTPTPIASPFPTATPNPTLVTSETATTLAQGWPILEQRPLNLPVLAAGSSCPSALPTQVNPSLGPALGSAPVYSVGGEDWHSNVIPFASPSSFGGGGSGWGGQRVLWYIAPSYSGPVLVRGRQLDGPHEMRFNGGVDQGGAPDLVSAPFLTELHLLGGSEYGGSAANWFGYTRIHVPG
jgi:hypothetical protein